MKSEYLGRLGTEALLRLIKSNISEIAGDISGNQTNWGSLRDVKFKVDPETGELIVSSEHELPGIWLEDGFIYLRLENGGFVGTIVGMEPRGEWNENETYNAMDIVYFQGDSWICLSECTAVEPSEGDQWTMLASKGKDGDPGQKGDPGTAAGFGTPTATVDANVGTPSVTVTASGPDTAKEFKFEFKNIKGATGAKGADGITSFNGRTGAIKPATGDYTAAMVGALPTAGGTITGDIKYQRKVWSGVPLQIIESEGSNPQYGAGLILQAGGLTILGGGEAGTSLYNAMGTDPETEQCHIASDAEIYLHTNCQTIANRKTVTVSKTGMITAPGGFSGNASSATKLATARTIRTNLASTDTASFDGSGNITPGVTGILPVANGGTGVNTIAKLAAALGGETLRVLVDNGVYGGSYLKSGGPMPNVVSQAYYFGWYKDLSSPPKFAMLFNNCNATTGVFTITNMAIFFGGTTVVTNGINYLRQDGNRLYYAWGSTTGGTNIPYKLFIFY